MSLSTKQPAVLDPCEAFGAFSRDVATDDDLFARLQNSESQEMFVARAIELGAELGWIFGPDEVRAALHAASGTRPGRGSA